MPDATGLSDLAHANYLIWQRVWKYTLTRDFAAAVSKSTHEGQMELRALIVRGDNEALRRKVKEILSMDLECKSIVELRQMARNHEIKYWNNLPKSSLLAALKKRIDDVNKQNNDPEQHRVVSTGDETPGTTIGVLGREIQCDSGSDIGIG